MLQEPLYLIVAMTTLLAVVGMSAVLYRLLASRDRAGNRLQTGAGDSSLRFAPMERLLASEDFEYLKAQPGYRPEIAARLRSRRVTIFKRYLGILSAEFNELHRALRVLTIYAPIDRSETARVLIEQRLLFSVRLMQVRVRLAFYAFDLKPVDVSGLVQTVDTMRRQVRQMSEGMAFSPAAA